MEILVAEGSDQETAPLKRSVLITLDVLSQGK